MLNYQDFQPYDSSNKTLFRFKKLKPEDETEGIYSCTQTNLRYRVSLFTNHHQVALLHALWQRGVFGNIKGFFKKKNSYFCFTDVEGFETLTDLVERQKGNQEYFSQYFCSQLIESVLDLANICDQVGCPIWILRPCKIMVSEKDKIFSFKLVYPFCHSLFQGLSSQIVTLEAQFCAPQILVLADNQYQLVRKPFPKAILYSLGLLLLFCFGYRIKSQERVLALKNGKQFMIFLKMIRKEIKSLHGGKFISKIIKILMEQSDLVRDTITTFQMKFKSAQLTSLKKFVFEPNEIPSGLIYIPTMYTDHSDPLNRGSINRTIEINGSAISTYNSPQNISSPQPNNVLNSSFKKSPESMHRQSLNASKVSNRSKEGSKYLIKMMASAQSNNSDIIKQEQIEEEKMREEDIQSDLSSPIDINVDWEDMDADDIWTTQKKSVTKSNRSSFSSKKNVPDVIDELDENEIEMTIVVTNVAKEKELFKFQQEKRESQKDQRQKMKKSKKNLEEEQLKAEKLKQAKEAESNVELHQKILIKKKSSHEGNESSNNFNKRCMTLVEEGEPEIIKYCEEELQVSQPTFLKKKVSSGAADLQAMSLVEEGEDVQEDDLSNTAEGRTNQNYAQLKEELNKKSETCFIIVLISFLLYKVIDFVIV